MKWTNFIWSNMHKDQLFWADRRTKRWKVPSLSRLEEQWLNINEEIIGMCIISHVSATWYAGRNLYPLVDKLGVIWYRTLTPREGNAGTGVTQLWWITPVIDYNKCQAELLTPSRNWFLSYKIENLSLFTHTIKF